MFSPWGHIMSIDGNLSKCGRFSEFECLCMMVVVWFLFLKPCYREIERQGIEDANKEESWLTVSSVRIMMRKKNLEGSSGRKGTQLTYFCTHPLTRPQ
jgi:hypothetical protein